MEEQLSNLQEIALPEPVAYTPQTIGWYILAFLVLISVILLFVRWRKQVRKNLYRREALSRLDEIEAGKIPLTELPVLVKRVALAFTPREKVAGLSGKNWLEFLDSTLVSKEFSTGPGRLLPELSYSTADSIQKVSDSDQRELFDLIRRWIRRHRAGI
jgi:hypothetical protein